MKLEDILKKIDFYALNEAQEYVYKNKKELMEKFIDSKIPSKTFYKATSILSSQSRSPAWEKAFILKNNAEKISSSLGKGDLLHKKIYYEYKISGRNVDKAIHVVQVRMWQNVSYIIQYITDYFDIITFKLSHDQMNDELEILKATAAHGTKKANKDNENIEYRFTIHKESKHMDRWVSKYKTNEFK